YSGTSKKGEAVINVGKKKRERVNRILRMHASRSEDLGELQAGDIGAVIGFKISQTGDTIGLENHQVLLEDMAFPEPVISVAIEPKTMSDHDKLANALRILSWEDPTFTWKENVETGQMVISGMGELHLDVLTTKLTDDMKVDVRIGNPQVSYRESITKANEDSFEFSKVIAQKENSASVSLRVTPLGQRGGLAYENTLSNKLMPIQMFEAVERGVRSSMQSGIQFGYEVCDMKVELTGVRYSETFSSEFAFEAAAAQCFDKACKGAGAVLMEPVMEVIVSVPAQYVGEVISSLTMRGGIISSMESRISGDVIHAQAPLSKLFGYSTALRSSTQGRGTFSMTFNHYAPSERQSAI
ncbi:MAG: EF-Tu/IF-2/RF-3 family GTPase, partial [Sphaerochaetaceae bacterium]